MKLAFSIDALDAAGKHAWRLQQDRKTWKPCTYASPLQDDDAQLDKAEAGAMSGLRMKTDRDIGLVKQGRPGMFDFLMRGIFTHAVLHRLSTPPLPSREQMLTTISGLAPGTPWLLYLDAAGHFRALDSGREPIIGNLDIAVRGEIASSPDYVGPDALCNESLMDRTWRQFLGGWLEHLQSGNMAVFVPDVEKLKEEADYLAMIDRQQAE